jgi:hypothetical protein
MIELLSNVCLLKRLRGPSRSISEHKAFPGRPGFLGFSLGNRKWLGKDDREEGENYDVMSKNTE